MEITAIDIVINCLERQRSEITKTIEALKVVRTTKEVCEIDLSNAPVFQELLKVVKSD